MNKPLLVLLSAGCLVSCHKDGNKPDNNWTWFGTDNTAVYNYVLINASQVINKADSRRIACWGQCGFYRQQQSSGNGCGRTIRQSSGDSSRRRLYLQL